MNKPFANLPEPSSKTVYVRSVLVADLPDEVQERAGNAELLYAVHNAKGERMALVTDRSMAFALAREHDFSPVNVH